MNLKHLKNPYVLLLIGPPLSGKTTWINNNITDDNIVIISRDQILLDEHGSNNYNDAFSSVNQKDVDSILHKKMLDASKNKQNVIVDMTNLSSKRRKYTLSYFDNYYKVGIIFPMLNWDEYLTRNKLRLERENKFIPEHVLKNMMNSYTPIRNDEGFNKIISL